jgi:WD40 repeat protein
MATVAVTMEGHHLAAITDFVVLAEHDAMLTCAADKTIMCWLKRDSGKYWPSFTLETLFAPTKMLFVKATNILFAALESGEIKHFEIAADFNSMAEIKGYQLHKNAIVQMSFDESSKILFSASRDRMVVAFGLETGLVLDAYNCGATCLALATDLANSILYVGDSGGHVHTLQLVSGKFEPKHMKLHRGGVTALAYCPERKMLASAGMDCTVNIVEGESVFTLSGHRGSVRSLLLLTAENKLVSFGGDSRIVEWDLKATRKQKYRENE